MLFLGGPPVAGGALLELANDRFIEVANDQLSHGIFPTTD